MLSQIEAFVNWIHRRNAEARTWRDYRGDLAQFAAVVGDCDPAKVTFREIDLFTASQRDALQLVRAVTDLIGMKHAVCSGSRDRKIRSGDGQCATAVAVAAV